MSTPNLAGLSAGLFRWKTFAAMVRPIEAATAIMIAALKKDCGARGCARRTSKISLPRARRRARPLFCPFVGIRRPKVDQPARRAAQSLQDQCFGAPPSTNAVRLFAGMGHSNLNFGRRARLSDVHFECSRRPSSTKPHRKRYCACASESSTRTLVPLVQNAALFVVTS